LGLLVWSKKGVLESVFVCNFSLEQERCLESVYVWRFNLEQEKGLESECVCVFSFFFLKFLFVDFFLFILCPFFKKHNLVCVFFFLLIYINI
jgi:hypothetical protein